MKYLLLFPVVPMILFTLFSSSAPAPAPPEPEGTHPPIAVLELFTSQGCSSCPPADELLADYADAPGVIALSFHVDYWNYLGWKDPFSSPYFSARQTDYTEQIGARTYTPQLVVNGTDEMIGSRRTEVKKAIEEALQRKARFAPEFTSTQAGNMITVDYRLGEDPKGHRVTALLVQPKAESAVQRGENRGRELEHVNVVRAMEHAPAAASGKLKLELPTDVVVGDLEIILLVQEEGSQVIVGGVRS